VRGAEPSGPSDLSDAARIAASLTESAAFAPIFERHARVLYRYLLSRVDPQSAEDLLSEVFVIAFRRRASYDTTYEDARPWLLGIATNALRHHRRAESRRLTMLERVHRSGRDQRDVMPEDVANAVADRDEVEAVRTALARLDPKYADVVMLFSAFGLSYEEIARALGLRIGTVRSRLSRGRAQLRELLTTAGQYPEQNDLTSAAGNHRKRSISHE
jgi:RNA polymerase sigma factor (sigma-70 family)